VQNSKPAKEIIKTDLSYDKDIKSESNNSKIAADRATSRLQKAGTNLNVRIGREI
jgi:thiamine pyrophosphokinase